MDASSPDAAARRWHHHLGLGAWRRKMRGNPATAALYRGAVGVVGTLVVLLGIALIPLPGPGWLTVFIGLSILASEFAWADRLLRYTRGKFHVWTAWIAAQPRPAQAVVGASGLVLMVAAALVFAAWQGVDLPLTGTSASAQ